MKKRWCILLLSLCSLATLQAQVFYHNAIAPSLGGASTTYLHSFAIESNVAALAYTPSQVAISGQNRYGLSEYSTVMLAGTYQTKIGTLGASYLLDGTSLLRQNKAQVAIAKKLNKDVAAGVSLNLHHFSSADAYYSSSVAMTFNAGIYYRISEKLNAGFQFFNPNRSLLTKSPKERLSSVFRIGTDYAVGQNIKLYADAVQSTGQKLDLNAGLELNKEMLKIRGGFGLKQQVAMGIGWKKNKVQVDASVSYHNQLGISPSLQLGYAL